MINPMKKYLQKGGSIVDYLKSKGLDSSKTARKILAQERGLIGNFSAQDNLALLDKLQNSSDNRTMSMQFQDTQDVGPDGKAITVRTLNPVLQTNPENNIEEIIPNTPIPLSVRNPAIKGIKKQVQIIPQTTKNIDDDIYAKDATNRLNMYRNNGYSTMGSKTLPEVIINSYSKKIPDYSRTNKNNLGFWDSMKKGSTEQIDFNALRNINTAVKTGKGMVITSRGERKEFSSLTEGEKNKLRNELNSYKNSYKF